MLGKTQYTKIAPRESAAALSSTWNDLEFVYFWMHDANTIKTDFVHFIHVAIGTCSTLLIEEGNLIILIEPVILTCAIIWHLF